jgi:hypothetical protein
MCSAKAKGISTPKWARGSRYAAQPPKAIYRRDGRCGRGIEFENAVYPDNSVGIVSAFEFCKLHGSCAVDKKAAAHPALLLSDPVTPTVTTDHEDWRPQTRGRFGCLFILFHEMLLFVSKTSQTAIVSACPNNETALTSAHQSTTASAVVFGAAQGHCWDHAAASIDYKPIECLSDFLPKRMQLPSGAAFSPFHIDRNDAHRSLPSPLRWYQSAHRRI